MHHLCRGLYNTLLSHGRERLASVDVNVKDCGGFKSMMCEVSPGGWGYGLGPGTPKGIVDSYVAAEHITKGEHYPVRLSHPIRRLGRVDVTTDCPWMVWVIVRRDGQWVKIKWCKRQAHVITGNSMSGSITGGRGI